MARSQKPFALLFTCSVACMAAVACSDDEDDLGGGTAGNSTSGAGGGSSAGSGNGGSSGSNNGGMNSSGSNNGGSAGSATGGGGTSTAGTPNGSAGMEPSAGGEGGMPGSAGEAGAPLVEGGAPGAAGTGNGGAGMAGEGGGGDGDGLRLEYTFDENAGIVLGDSSGRGLNGTLTDATAWTAQGRSGSALALSGGANPTQYATLPAGVFDGAQAITIAAWVRLTQNPIWARLFDVGNAGVGSATRFMYLALDSNLGGQTGIRFAYFGGDGNGEALVTTGTVLPLNVWKHLAVTMAEDGEQTIYIDGFPAAAATTVAIPPAELEPLSAISYLGKSRFPDAGFTGAMDDFVVYDRVLSHQEVAVLAAPKGDYTRLAFEEAQGTTSQDSSDRNVDATLDGGASWTAGRLGAAVQVSGDAQYVTLSEPIAGCTTELSIALWVKHTAVNNWSRILDFGGTSDNFMFLTASGPEGKLFFTIKNGANETALTGTKTVPADNAWHHVAIVVSPTVGSVYVDGEISGNMANPVSPSDLGLTNEHWLGKSRFSVDPYFNGAFDEVRIMCRALSSDEVKNLAFK